MLFYVFIAEKRPLPLLLRQQPAEKKRNPDHPFSSRDFPIIILYILSVSFAKVIYNPLFISNTMTDTSFFFKDKSVNVTAVPFWRAFTACFVSSE